MAIVPKSPFPNVPPLPGVPQVRRNPLFPTSAPPVLGLALAVGRLWQSLTATPQWGIFNAKGQRVVLPDSVMDLAQRNDSRISDFPVQAGSFASYNKVANPFDVVVRLVKGGTKAERQLFLEAVQGLAESLDLFTVLTPERSYRNVNVTGYELTRRGVGGAHFLDVDVFLREVRQVSPQYSEAAKSTQNAQDPGSVPPANQGKLQPQPLEFGGFDPATNLRVEVE